MGAIGQALLTDYAAAMGVMTVLLALALLTRKKRDREIGIGETLRMIIAWAAAFACVVAPAFQPSATLTQGLLFALLIAAAELASA